MYKKSNINSDIQKHCLSVCRIMCRYVSARITRTAVH